MSRLVSKPIRPRATDVALRAGVSQSAVSRAFTNGSVSPQVRARIFAVAQELGYRPNAMASAIMTRRSNMVAIIMTTQTNSHFPEVLSELSRAADRRGLRVLLFTVDDPALVSGVVDQILSYQVDGVVSLTEFPAEAASELEAAGINLILYNRARAVYPANLVSCDHRAAGHTLGAYLLALGHRRFAAIHGWPKSVLAIDRLEGFFDALRAANLDPHDVPVATGDFSYESGRAGASEILRSKADVTCILCINDMMAFGAIDEATSIGLNVPEQLSVAGFDGIPASRLERYQITTMQQPVSKVAAAALDLIVKVRHEPDRPLESRLFPCSLVEGKSTSRVPRRPRGTPGAKS